MGRLGDALRAQRERLGRSLEDAAEDTRIREKFLRALEEGDYQTLPGAVYTKGFLRNYAEYLGLAADELVALFQAERGRPEATRSFEPMRPIVRRGVILTPAVLLPVLVLAAVGSFVGYLYYQFSTFAVPPTIEIVSPAVDAVSHSAEYLIGGRTDADARVTVRVFPGPETVADIRPSADGAFSALIQLKPGPNRIEVQVLDPTGKVNQASRTVRYEAVAAPQVAPQLVLEQPADGVTFTDAPVTVAGRVDRSVSAVTVNGVPVATQPDGTFSVSVTFAAGPQTIRVAARNAAGGAVEVARTVAVAYTVAVVTVRVSGGDAWLTATVDGARAPNTDRVYTNGQIVSFTGRAVTLRTGNAGATFVTHNGRDLGRMGEVGQVAERTFAAQ